ncbi:MAG: hypothetical protein U0414_10045 [Polyangiaceae bacterium]
MTSTIIPTANSATGTRRFQEPRATIAAPPTAPHAKQEAQGALVANAYTRSGTTTAT